MNNRKRITLAAGIGILILILILILVLLPAALGDKNHQPQTQSAEDLFDPNAKEGMLPNLTQAQIQQELDRQVQEGAMNLQIASQIVFDHPDAAANPKIMNSSANHYNLQVTLTLDDSAQTVYTSGMIAPGYYVDSITLSNPPAPGTYPTTAVFTAYDTETLEPIGSATIGIIIQVMK